MQLAVDFVMTLFTRRYDVGVLFSADTDLKPALEAVLAMKGDPYPRCEVACWRPPKGYAVRIGVSGSRVWCHYLDERDYQAVRDEIDYTQR